MLKVSELSGAQLDYYVARAEKHKVEILFGQCVVQHAEYHDEIQYVHFNPTMNWGHGGPLIDKFQMYLDKERDGYWSGAHPSDEGIRGDTPLQAICRAVVRAAFGDEVEEVAGC